MGKRYIWAIVAVVIAAASCSGGSTADPAAPVDATDRGATPVPVADNPDWRAAHAALDASCAQFGGAAPVDVPATVASTAWLWDQVGTTWAQLDGTSTAAAPMQLEEGASGIASRLDPTIAAQADAAFRALGQRVEKAWLGQRVYLDATDEAPPLLGISVIIQTEAGLLAVTGCLDGPALTNAMPELTAALRSSGLLEGVEATTPDGETLEAFLAVDRSTRATILSTLVEAATDGGTSSEAMQPPADPEGREPSTPVYHPPNVPVPDASGWLTAFDARPDFLYFEPRGTTPGTLGPATLSLDGTRYAIDEATPFSGYCGPPAIANRREGYEGAGASIRGCLVFVEVGDDGAVEMLHFVMGPLQPWGSDGFAAVFEDPPLAVDLEGAVRMDPAGLVFRSRGGYLLVPVSPAVTAECPLDIERFDAADFDDPAWVATGSIEVASGLVIEFRCDVFFSD